MFRGLHLTKNLVEEALRLHVERSKDHHAPHMDSGKVQFGPLDGKITWEGIDRALRRGKVTGVPAEVKSLSAFKRWIKLDELVSSYAARQQQETPPEQPARAKKPRKTVEKIGPPLPRHRFAAKATLTKQALDDAFAVYEASTGRQVTAKTRGLRVPAGEGFVVYSASGIGKALRSGLVEGVPKRITSLNGYKKWTGMPIHEAGFKAKAILNRVTVRNVVLAFTENRKVFPREGSEKIRHGKLGELPDELKYSWWGLSSMMREGRVKGIPEGTTLNMFVRELFYSETHIDKVRLRDRRPDISELNRLSHKRHQIMMLPRVKYSTKLKDVFTTVAWHIISKHELPATNDDFIEHGSFAQSGMRLKDLDRKMFSGKIEGIPKGILLHEFSALVASRLVHGNYRLPTTEELELALVA